MKFARAQFWVRVGTSDSSVVMGTFGGDEYRLQGREISGWAVDLGAHIGVIAVALLAEHPEVQVIAVEPLPANIELLQRNLAPYGERAHVMAAAGGNGKPIEIGYAFGGLADLPDDYKVANHYIGRSTADIPGRDNAEVVTVPTYNVAGLMKAHDLDEIAFIKTDCEGGEYPFFADPKANRRVKTIVGEWHDDSGERIRKLLEPTHKFIRHEPSIPGSTSCTGLFEAIRK